MIRLSKSFFLLLICLVFFGLGCSKQAKKERYLKNASEYLAAKKYNKAEIEFMNVLRLEGTNSAAISGLGAIFFERGQFDRAMPALNHAKLLGADDPSIRLKIAQIYLFAGDLPKARQEISPLLDGKPSHDEALTLLADISKNPKQISESIGELTRLKDQASTRPLWHLAMSALALKQTNAPAAKKYLDQAASLDPNSSKVHFSWGNYFWSQKDVAQAGSSFQKAAELEPVTSPYRLRWVDFNLRTGATNEAVAILKDIASQAPGHLPAWVYLARMAFAQRNLAEGSNYVQKILTLEPSNLEARLMQSDLLRFSGNAEEAVKNLEKLREQYPRSAQIAYSLGVAYVQLRNPSKAIPTLIEGHKLDQNHIPTVLLLSELHIQRRELTAAVELLNELLKKRPDITQAYFLLASALTAQNRYADALALYERVDKVTPGTSQAPFFAGITYRIQNRTTEARRAFERALAAAPEDPLVTGQLLDLDLQEKKFAAAMQRAQSYANLTNRKAIGHFFEARVHLAQTNNAAAAAALESAIAADPEFTSAYGILAQTYVRLNKTKEALSRLEALQAKDPRNLAAIVMSGQLLQESKDFKNAASKFRRALQLAPDFMPALNNLAYILAEKFGDLKEAETLARRAREIDPNQAHIADTLGWIYFKQKDYSLALPLLQEAATKLPDSAEIQFHAGMTYYMMGIADAAELALKKAVTSPFKFDGQNEAAERLKILSLSKTDVSPDAVQTLKNRLQQQPEDLLALTKLAGIYLATGKHQEALWNFELAKKINPHSAAVLVGIGKAYQSLNNTSAALEAVREARKLSPADPEVVYLLGKLMFSSGDHRRSIPLLEEASRAGKPEVHFDLAQAYFTIGQLDKAEEELKKVPAAAGANLLKTIGLLKSPSSIPQNEQFVQAISQSQPRSLAALSLTGFLQKEKSNSAQATASFENLLKEYPHFTLGRIALASLYLREANGLEKALEQVMEGRKTASENQQLTRLLGEIYFQKKQYRLAIPLLQAALRQSPKDPELLYSLGISLHHQEKSPEAANLLNEALKLSPGSSLAPEAKLLLTQSRQK